MMIKIPQQTMQQFETRLRKEKIPSDKHNSFKKWLRYYLDYCHKYKQHHQNSESLPNFINKLREKNNLNSNKSMPLIQLLSIIKYLIFILTGQKQMIMMK